jgi:hypothetical protein
MWIKLETGIIHSWVFCIKEDAMRDFVLAPVKLCNTKQLMLLTACEILIAPLEGQCATDFFLP